MKVIGVNHSGYATYRNITSLPFTHYKVEKKTDLFKFPEHVYYRLTGKVNPVLLNLHNDFGLAKCDLWHFFNTLSFSKKPWFTTFETMLPRFHGKYEKRGVELMVNEHCKQLIAISECAKNLHLNFIKTNHPAYFDIIESKTTAIHPSQKLLIDNISEKLVNAMPTFVFVGSEFFRKGGAEILYVADKLLTEGKNFHLHIVSKMESEDSVSTNRYEQAAAIIHKYPSNITHHKYLPNTEVLSLLKECDVALLPSYRETYGYTVLEAQAAGCPVITTNVLAFEEINNNDMGWIVNLEIDELKRPIQKTMAEREKTGEMIKAGLETYVRNILDNPSQIKIKARAALNNIKLKHNPATAATQLENIYNKAF